MPVVALHCCRRRRQQGGFVLLVAMIILFALASMVISLGLSARAEGQASANQVAAFEADEVERGAEQYVLSILTDNFDGLPDMTEDEFANIPVGKGKFWIIRPDYLDDDLPQYGLVDESSKINLNTADENTLTNFTDMTPDIADSIIDWVDADDTPTGNGAESSDYLGQTPPYNAKNAPFDTVEELLQVRGVTRQLLYGQLGTGIEGGQSSDVGSDAVRLNGWHDFFTVYSQMQSTTGSTTSTTASNQINVNQAPAAVLAAFLKGISSDITDDDINAILAARRTAIIDDPTATDWFQTALGAKYNPAMGTRIIGQGKQFMADIVAVSGNGRAFKRCRIVVDTMQTPAQIVYRRDLTDGGFPLDPSILAQLRAGNGDANSVNSTVSTGGGL